MTQKRQNYHTDVMHESRLTPPCKTTKPSPGRVHGNPGRMCKNQLLFIKETQTKPYLNAINDKL